MPKRGDVEDGYVYIGKIGSNPGDPTNWKRIPGAGPGPDPEMHASRDVPAQGGDPGLGERLYRGMSDVGQGIAYGGAQAGEAVGVLPKGTASGYREKVEKQIADYEARNANRVDLVRDVGRGLPWAMVPAGKAGEVVQAAGTLAGKNLIGRGLQNAGVAISKSPVTDSAIMGALQGGSMIPEEGMDRSAGAAVGGLGGAAGGFASKLFGMAARPGTTQPRIDLANEARKQGFNVTAGMSTKGRVPSNIEGALDVLPFTAGNMKQIYESNAQQANKIASLAVGGAGDAHLTDDSLRTAGDQLGREFNRLSAGQKVSLDPQFFADIATAKQKQSRILLDELKNSKAGSMIDSILKMPQNVKLSISGDQYQATRSALGKAKADAYKAGNSNLGDVLGTIQDGLDEAAYRSAPNKQDWADVRQQWSAYKALTYPGVVQDGNVNLQKLGGYLQRKNPEAWIAASQSPVNNLAKLAPVLKTQLPNSGTTERSAYLSALTGSAGAAAGGLLGGWQGAGLGAATGALMLPKAAELAYMNPLVQAFFERGILPQSQRLNAQLAGPWATGAVRSFAAPYAIDQLNQ